MSVTKKKIGLKRWVTSFVLICFILTQVMGGIFLYAKPAHAQFDPVPGIQTTLKNIKDFIKQRLAVVAVKALTNFAAYFMRKLAYDAATAIVSGGKGQMPLFQTKGWKSYMEDVTMGAAGEFIGSLKDLTGVDFCAAPNPQVQLGIQIGLAEVGAPPAPKCDFSQIMKNWDTFIEQAKTGEILKNFSVAFEPGQSDLSLALNISERLFDKVTKDTLYNSEQRKEGQGWKPLESLISGQTKTPASAIKKESEQSQEQSKKAEEEKWSNAAPALGQGALDALWSVASTFINTLASKGLQRIFQKGMWSLADLLPGNGEVYSPEFAGQGGRKAAEASYADLLTPEIKEGGAYDILADFVNCPDKYRNLNNCVIDGQFEAGLRQVQSGLTLTVRDALDQGFLHGDWPLIPERDTARNQDSYCFQKGYCYSNLVKLRNARIIPIGWEIAANSSANNGWMTLKQIVDGFNNCNDQDVADADHPWCHLIDPDWLLKAPLFQCRAKVYGPLLETSESNIRQETCVDSPSCIAEDSNGNCQGGWGYCTREKNIWRLNADTCDTQYDSCQTLTSRQGTINSYLLNTVDYDGCSADDVGCQWFSKWQEKVGTDWKWTDRESGTPAKKTDRIYFNKNVEQCDAADEGCTEFLKTTKDTSLNLLQNPSFETFTGAIDDVSEDVFDGWKAEGSGGSPLAVSDAYQGSASLKIETSKARILTQEVETNKSLRGRTFTLSLYAKNCTTSDSMSLTTAGESSSSEPLSSADTPADTWTRFSLTYTFTTSSDTKLNANIELISGAANCLVDAVQLEEKSEATDYHEGWANTGDSVYLKKAPEYDKCYNYNPDGTVKTADDADACTNFVGACMESEAGCEKFTPITGDPWVPGIATYPDDYCPAECVGYQTFAQDKTDFEPAKFPVYFIPTTATSCSSVEAGCDQFTNLETEAIENYSYLRRCQKPGTDEATYYTWEGSDTTGYQLKTWSLKKSNLTGVIANISPDGGIGPCTKLATDGVTCNDDRITGTCTKADMATNPDCREFYDTAGNHHYRLYSETIVSTDDCHPYRKTISTQTDCQSSGGKWDATLAECVYQAYPPESISCSVVGCRAYRGNTGANVMNVFSDDFESDAHDWVSGLTISAEALEAGGHSGKIDAGRTGQRKVGDLVRKNGVYLISFWARAGGTGGSTQIKFSNADSPILATNLSLTWQPYTLGPIEIKWDPASDDATTPAYEGETLNIAARGALVYFDNVVLREVTDRIYLVKDSWRTPASCDMTIYGGYLPQSMLGCSAYYDRENRIHYLKSFTNLCRPEAIGCQKVIDTKNSVATAEETYNAECKLTLACATDAGCNCPATGTKVCTVLKGQTTCQYDAGHVESGNIAEDTVVVPADSFSYLIVDDTKTCNPANKSCTAFGKPKLDSSGSAICTVSPACTSTTGCDCKRDGEVMCKVPPGQTSCTADFETVYLKNNPQKYTGQGEILCTAPTAGCEEFTDTTGTKYYFKDPNKRTCEWKENISYLGEQRTGWFRKDADGKDVPCYETYTPAGTFGIWKNGDPNYDRWVGICPAAQNLCTKFIDPSDTSGDNPAGEPYYYIKNAKLDALTSECKGQVSLKNGCVLFNDTSNLNLTYSSGATYKSSDRKSDEPGGLVNAIDCRQGTCKQCSGVWMGTPPFCVDDKDCPTGSTCSVSAVAPKNDSNLILKVQRDRVCGEWLACESSTPNWDSMTNQSKEICDAIGLCNQYQKAGEATACANFISDVQNGPRAQILDLKTYTSRDTSFKGMDYSGYSLYNKFPVEKLSQVNVAGSGEEDNWRLAFVEPTKCYDSAGGERSCGTSPAGTCDGNNDTTCGAGKCWNHLCAYDIAGNITGNISDAKALLKDATSQTLAPLCRAYPEIDSPFPKTIEPGGVRQSGFAKANICEEGDTKCECSYKKIEYKSAGATKYYSTVTTDFPPGICQGGPYEGKECNPDVTGERKEADPGKNLSCGPTDKGGTCAIKTKTSEVMGWQGYCLEKDSSRSINGDPKQNACLTWLPVDHLTGSPDIYNQYTEAGYAPGGKGQMCLKANLFMRPTVFAYCVHDSDSDWGRQCSNGSCQYPSKLCPDGYKGIEMGCHGPIGEGSGDDGFCNVAGWYDKCLVYCVPKGPLNGDECRQALKSGHERDFGEDVTKDDIKGDVNEGGDNASNIRDHCWGDYWVKSDDPNYKPGNGEFKKRDYALGCEQVVKIGETENSSTAWTNRLWQEGGYSVVSDVLGSGNYSKLNYEYQSANSPFGYASSPEGSTDILDIPFCSVGQYFILPNLDLSCGALPPASPTNESRPYLNIEVGATTSGCGIDDDCNRGVTCGATEGCYVYCVNDDNCLVPPSVDPDGTLGPCQANHYCAQSLTPSSCPDPHSTGGDDPITLCSVGGIRNTGTCVKFCGTDPTKSTCGGDPDCWTKECRSGQCYDIEEGVSVPSNEADVDPQRGIARLKQLFAESFGVMEWQDRNVGNRNDKGGYPAWSMGPSNTWDITEKGGTDQGIPNAKLPTPPVVASIGSCRDTKCQPHWPLAPGELPSITINGKSSGTVISRTGSLRATIQFFFWADADQGPIKSVIVDYGNGVVINSGATNFYKNYRGYKSDGSSACDNSDFGHSANACAEEPRTYNPTYTCQRGIGSNWNATCPDPTVSGGCCVFVPKVQVLDNWGWCNGTCGDAASPGGTGCYDASNLGRLDECRTANFNNASTSFSGRIIVVPKP